MFLFLVKQWGIYTMSSQKKSLVGVELHAHSMVFLLSLLTSSLDPLNLQVQGTSKPLLFFLAPVTSAVISPPLAKKFQNSPQEHDLPVYLTLFRSVPCFSNNLLALTSNLLQNVFANFYFTFLINILLQCSDCQKVTTTMQLKCIQGR